MTDVQLRQNAGVDDKKTYSISDIIKLRTVILDPMCFQIITDDDVSGSNIDEEAEDKTKFKHYVQFKKKSYTKGDV